MTGYILPPFQIDQPETGGDGVPATASLQENGTASRNEDGTYDLEEG